MAAMLSKRSTCEAGPGERVALLMAADEPIRYYCGGYYTTHGRIGTKNQLTQPRHGFEFVNLLSIMRCVAAGWLEEIDGASHYERRWRLTVTGRREMDTPGFSPVQLNLFNYNQTS